MDKDLDGYGRDLKTAVEILTLCDKTTNKKIVNYLAADVQSKLSSFQHKIERQKKED